jgi:hypothetical protein
MDVLYLFAANAWSKELVAARQFVIGSRRDCRHCGFRRDSAAWRRALQAVVAAA